MPPKPVFAPHADAARLNKFLPMLQEFQELASQHGIFDVFQDNGGKLLQVLLLLGLKAVPGREGNDAVDAKGTEYELKSVNRISSRGKKRSNPSFTTHHHLNPVILAKYRKVAWVFAVYSGIELEAVYLLQPKKLEVYYREWEARYRLTGRDINNPKIPIRFVETNGQLLFQR